MTTARIRVESIAPPPRALVGVFETQPAMRFAMRLRDAIVRPFGLRRSDAFKAPRPHSFRAGEQSPLFRVLARNRDEILFGEDDSHLDFRLSMLVERGPSGASLTLTTVVRMNNWIGRAYFAVVRWGYRIIVPA